MTLSLICAGSRSCCREGQSRNVWIVRCWGDNLYTSFDGNAATNKGANYITGGTGKYAGITGQGPWVCSGAAGGESMCNQSLTYEIK